jgi:TolA-binding protein
MRRLKVALIFAFILSTGSAYAVSSDDLKKCACENSDKAAALDCIVKTKDSYLKLNKYSEFVELLKSSCPGNKNIASLIAYYAALTRYEQLKHLEEANSWDEYFAKGNDYRDDIVKGVSSALDLTAKDDGVRVYACLLAYKFHKDQQDNFTEDALAALMNGAEEYSRLSKNMQPIKDAADGLSSYGERPSAKELYRIYSRALVGSDVPAEELKATALRFYNEGNLELAESIYDSYIEKLSKDAAKENVIQELKAIAAAFIYKDSSPKDSFYAEKVFKKIELLGGEGAFEEELIYLRGFNLEKNKEFAKAKDIYETYLKRFPSGKYADELLFKTGVIFTYILRDRTSGRTYFEQVADKKASVPQSLSALYQLGLLKQWEGDLVSAKAYYNKLTEKSEGKITDTLKAAQERLKEIESGKLLEHNLKSFMDASLKNEYAGLDMSKVELKPSLYQPNPGQEIEIATCAYLSSSGCFNVELQYLWSGDLGGASPAVKDPSFKSSYENPGTKMVGLVLISPSGITDYSLDLIDVR